MAATKDRQIDEMTQSMVAKGDDFSAASAAIALLETQVPSRHLVQSCSAEHAEMHAGNPRDCQRGVCLAREQV